MCDVLYAEREREICFQQECLKQRVAKVWRCEDDKLHCQLGKLGGTPGNGRFCGLFSLSPPIDNHLFDVKHCQVSSVIIVTKFCTSGIHYCSLLSSSVKCPYVFHHLSTWSWGRKSRTFFASHSFQHYCIGFNSSLMIFWASHTRVSLIYYCKRFTTSPFMIGDMFNEWSRCSYQHPTLSTPTPAPWLTQPLEWSRSLFGSQGSGAWNWHDVIRCQPCASCPIKSSKSLQQIATNDDVPQTNWLCEDWMGWTYCSHMKVEVNGAWQKLSTWHAARKPDWQAEGTYGPIWQDGNLKGRYRKVDHQFALQLFIVPRFSNKVQVCWPTGSVGRKQPYSLLKLPADMQWTKLTKGPGRTSLQNLYMLDWRDDRRWPQTLHV